MITDLSAPPLGIVPIFVNAGAALVPAIVASVASVFAILFKPRELLALVRRKPWLPVAILAAGAAAWFAVSWARSPSAQAATVRRTEYTGPAKTDWTEVALKHIRDKANAGKTTGVKPTWAYSPDTDPTATQWVLSSPAHANQTARVFATATLQDVASLYGLLFAVDAKSGKEIWRAEKAGDEDLKPFFSSPALSPDQKSLVVGQGLHADEDCSLLCFNADTGELRWKIKTPLHIESSPAIRGDLVVVGAGAIEGPDRKPKSHPGFVLATRLSDGKELWRHDLPDPESCPAIADDNTIYIGSGFNGNAIVALRPEPDDELKSKNLPREIWRTKSPYPITGPVTLAGDLLLVGGGNCDFVTADPNPAGVVMALDRKTGQVKWQTPLSDSVLNRIVVAADKVLCPVRNGQVIALSLANGKPLWATAVSGKAPILAGLAVSPDGQTVFAASNDGHLALLNTADGKLIERHPLNRKDKPSEKGLTVSTPRLASNMLFIGSETGGLRAFDLLGAPPATHQPETK